MSRSAETQVQSDIAIAFEHETGITVQRDRLGKQLTTLAIGGPLGNFIEPQNKDELQKALTFLSREGQCCRVFGSGSNALIPDSGLPDWTIRLGKGFRLLGDLSDGRFEIGGSVSLMWLSRELSDRGYAGLEFAGGIPASLGGAVKMNAGAHGGELGTVLESIVCLEEDGTERTFSKQELGFGYRRSRLPAGAVVISAVIQLIPGDAVEISARRREYLEMRKRTQPLQLPSAGSIFKNPVGAPAAGALIEQSGLRGRRIGGAQISELHGNWIVNPQRRASDKDVLDLIALCQAEVSQRFGVQLEPEILIWR